MNLSLPTVSLSNTSTSISRSLLISKLNSSFQIGFFPPPGFGFVENSCVPILSLEYGSAFPNMPWPAFSSTPRRHFTTNLPNLGGAGAEGGAIICAGTCDGGAGLRGGTGAPGPPLGGAPTGGGPLGCAPGGPRGGAPEAGGPGLGPAPVIERGGKPGGGPDLGGAAGGPRGGGAPPPGGPVRV